MNKPAQWICTKNPGSRRNVWQCFRREFNLDFAPITANLNITADSRYVLFVNGTRLGNGPMKYFQEHIPYDSFDIAPFLRPGKNTIGVVVNYYGVGTMQHRFGKPGLWVQVDICGGTQKIYIASDTSFQTAPCVAMDSRSPRSSVQQAFTEHIDARLWQDFAHPDYVPDDIQWEASVLAGRSVASLYPRNIPMLTEETRYPDRISRLRRVSPPETSYVVDSRSLMLEQDGYQNCNPATVQGLVATCIHMKERGKITLYLDVARRYPVFLSDRWYKQEEILGHSKLYLSVDLDAGDHLLVFDISAREHWMGVHFALHSEVEYTLAIPHEYTGDDICETPFLVLGPFSPSVYTVDDVPGIDVDKSHTGYQRAIENMAADGLKGLESYQRPIPKELVSDCDPFLLFANAREDDTQAYTEYQVPLSLQNAVLPDNSWAEIPLFANADTEITVDFGKELVGYLQFEADAPAGTILDFYSYEYTDGGDIQHTWGMDPVWRYVCKEGRQNFTSFLRRGLRYCAIAVRNASRPVRLFSFSAIQSTYPLTRIGRFSCSDRLLTDIWEISAHTVKLCSEDTFVDCPAYEQVFWVGDSRNEALISHYIYGDTANVRRCLELVPQSAPQSPLLCNHVPSEWDSVIPNWSFAWVIACGEYYEYTSDLSFVQTISVSVRSCMDAFLEHQNEDGLLDIMAWNLLDWAPADQPNAGVVTHQNMFMVRALEELVTLLNAIGEDCSYYDERAKSMRVAINQHLWNEEKGAYYDCIHADGTRSSIYSVQTQICALLFNIPQSQIQYRLTMECVENPPSDYVQVSSPFMAFFLYEVFEKAGKTNLMLEDMREHYGTMIQHSASTCWEQYPESTLNKVVEGMLSRSHCHAWSAAPAYFLSRNVLGIRPLSPFWTKMEIAPQPCGITWARGSVPHPAGGKIDVEYTIVDDRMNLNICAPEHVELVVVMPDNLHGNPNITRTRSLIHPNAAK